jgi:hypothetical protein
MMADGLAAPRRAELRAAHRPPRLSSKREADRIIAMTLVGSDWSAAPGDLASMTFNEGVHPRISSD